MKIIAVSGAQGSGKTTLLEKLKTKDIQVDDFKVSRTVQQKMGWASLDEVYNSPTKMMQFQEQILHAKFAHDKELAAQGGDDVILVERSFTDIHAYAELWFDRMGMRLNPSYNQWMSSYKMTCLLCQTLYSGIIMVPLMKNIQWEDDPKRASKQDAEICYGKMTSFITDFNLADSSVPVHTIENESLTKRVNETLKFLKTFSTKEISQ